MEGAEVWSCQTWALKPYWLKWIWLEKWDKITPDMCANLVAIYKKCLTSVCQQGFCHQVLNHLLWMDHILISMTFLHWGFCGNSVSHSCNEPGHFFVRGRTYKLSISNTFLVCYLRLIITVCAANDELSNKKKIDHEFFSEWNHIVFSLAWQNKLDIYITL